MRMTLSRPDTLGLSKAVMAIWIVLFVVVQVVVANDGARLACAVLSVAGYMVSLRLYENLLTSREVNTAEVV